MLKTENIESIQCLRTLNHMFSLILTKCSRIQKNDKKKNHIVYVSYLSQVVFVQYKINWLSMLSVNCMYIKAMSIYLCKVHLKFMEGVFIQRKRENNYSLRSLLTNNDKY